MDIKKNDELIIEINDIGQQGEGIGKHDGYTLFVNNATVGDKVRVKVMKAKKNYGYARLVEVIEPSPFRVEPICKIANKCGGCNIMHLDYKQQLKYKHDKVINCLERIGKFDLSKVEVSPIIGMEKPYYYRNKVQLPVGKNKEGHIVMGFYARRTHSIINMEECYIQSEVNSQIFEIVRRFLEKYKVSIYDEINHKGLVRHIMTRVGFTTGQVMVCLVINGKKLPHEDKLVEELIKVDGMTSISLNFNLENTNVIMGEGVRTIWGEDFIIDYIGDVKYQISPKSFYQVNPIQTKVIYETALSYADLKGDETVWDLYCGIGTISLFMAQKAKKVYGVEIVEDAILDARRNARINDINNAEFYVGAAEEILPRKYKEDSVYADVIVVDPPRKGCEESLLDTIVSMEPKRFVYVSCDPATLARDLGYMAERGYEIKKVQAVDQFPHTTHVECVVLMSRVEK